MLLWLEFNNVLYIIIMYFIEVVMNFNQVKQHLYVSNMESLTWGKN